MSGVLFYIAAKDPGDQGGIYRCCFEEENGVRLRGFAAQPYINFLLRSADGTRLYAGGGEPAVRGFVSSYCIGADGALRKEAEFTAEKSNCHLLQVGNFLYAANYRDGSFSEFRLENGVVAEESRRITHHGSGPVEDRQENAHVHSCSLTPDGKYLAVLDLGSDTISSYALGKNGVAEQPEQVFHTRAGDGPRHMIFSMDGKTAYVLNELSNTVSSLQYEKGKFTFLSAVSTLPRLFKGKSKAAAIRFDPQNRLICVTNRGLDSVAAFAPGAHGALKMVSLTFAGGESPRDGNFIAPQWYCAACEDSGAIVFFSYRSGTFSPCGIRLTLPHPLYVLPAAGCSRQEKLRNTAGIRLDKKPFSRYIVRKTL